VRAKLSLLFPMLILLSVACSGAAARAVPPTASVEKRADLPASPTVAPTVAPSATAPAAERIKVSSNRRTEYYAVSGATSEEILSYIQAHAPLDDHGARAVGLTAYVPSLDWESNHDPRACAIARMNISIDLKVTLPSLANLAQLPQSIQASWNGYVGGVAAHEQRHVDIWLAGAQTIRQRMSDIQPTTGCAALEARVLEVWKTQQEITNRQQEQFHQQEFARLEAARAPLKAQIDTNRARLDALSSQIAGYDATMNTLSQQLDSLRSLMDSIQAQAKALEDKYRDVPTPPEVYEQYNRLISQYNSLIPSFNALVANYNNQAGQRNALVSQADALRAQTNDLVDQYNWAN
jgi:predicted secreted Zn-dependent protease